MKLQRQLNRVKDGKRYEKWVLVIPPPLMEKIGWPKGADIAVEMTSEGLLLRHQPSNEACANPITKIPFNHFRDGLVVEKQRDAIVRKLHAEGRVDREIGLFLDVSISTICRIRKQLGLAPNGHARKRGRRTWNTEEACRLHAAGLADLEIAETVGVSRESISRWRLAEKLPRNGRPGPTPADRDATGVPVRCHRCSYAWLYRGMARSFTCPNCRTTVTRTSRTPRRSVT